ncbi:tetratricopeptide repeat protein [Rhizobium sp. KVB221]|uniref:Tetratricopeptide repeat protein n=1 Tax=Rhizobium setariae TaxID=2801340 RepID=A0A937CMX5_9HYPH|nr:tetratricopeptide repeat protein [Rhizobium setariae]MBL0374840.1 tetratricopeptide repeat protein [Rhizobium setariae]
MKSISIGDELARATGLHQHRRFEDAVAIYRRILEVEPTNRDVLVLLASGLRSLGNLDDAVALYDHIAAENPQRAEFWFNRANALSDIGRFDDAISSYNRSLEIDRDNASVLANLAIAEMKIGQAESATAHYRQALAIEPGHRIAAHNLGNILSEAGGSHEAAALFRQTIRNEPGLAEGHYNLGLVLLRLGDFANGFKEYEWRWDTADFFTRPNYRDIPVWNGESLKGRRLLVHAEQGLGDTIQFSRLLGLIRSLCDDVVFHIPANLERLLKTMPFDVQVASAHGAGDADYQIPLLSLPHRLKLTPGSIPQMSNHLQSDPQISDMWRQRLQLDGRAPTIGFVWRGNPNSPAERGRSLASAEEFVSFAELSGVRLIALQKLDADELETADTVSGWKVGGLSFTMEHPGPDMDNGRDAFIDTAAIMSSLDLIVSVCTAPLHLAGALGRPALGLLRPVPDWRWMMERSDTPWYPRMTLVRQLAGEGYRPAIARAAEIARTRLLTSSSS